MHRESTWVTDMYLLPDGLIYGMILVGEPLIL